MTAQKEETEFWLSDRNGLGGEQVNCLIGNFMPDQDRYPWQSRDHGIDDIPCKATKCVANRSGRCISPSLWEIGEDGRCVNFKPQKVEDSPRF